MASQEITFKAQVLTSRMFVSYLLITAALILSCRESLPGWQRLFLVHLGLSALVIALVRSRKGREYPLKFVADWYPVPAFPLLYKEVELLAQTFGNWGLTDIVQKTESLLFSGQPSLYLSLRYPWAPLSGYLHFCYLAYLGLIPVVAGIWYFSGRESAFRELILAVSATYTVAFLFYIVFPVDSPYYLHPRLREPLSDNFFYQTVHFFSASGGARGGAFPSSHVSISTVVWLVALKRDFRLGAALILIVPGIYLATVYGRFHYVLDVVAGLLLAGAVFAAVQRLLTSDSDTEIDRVAL